MKRLILSILLAVLLLGTACSEQTSDSTSNGNRTNSATAANVLPSCKGTGKDGKRVQIVYARENSTPSRYNYARWKARQLSQLVDGLFMESAKKYDKKRLVRWVFNKKCRPKVKGVTVPDGSLVDFPSFQLAMWNAGLRSNYRKYIVFADTDGSDCARSTFWDNNSLARSYSGWAWLTNTCWTSYHMTHEIGHLLGAVVSWAPNATPGYHCTDGLDIMCYSDAPGIQVTYPCVQKALLDCNGDDYYNPAPVAGTWIYNNPGSNIAFSPYLDRGGFQRWKLRK